MYDNEIKDQFVTLRAEGKSFGQISEQLGVVKSTLHRWEEEREADIARLRRLQWQETEAECGRRIEDHLTHLIYHMMDCEDRIKDFKTTEYSLHDAFAILRESRREYYRLRALLMGTPSRRPKSVEPVPSVVDSTSTKSNETERFAKNGTPEPRNTNDLQQPQSQSFDSVTPEVLRAEPRYKTESKSGHFSSQPSINPNPQPADAAQDSTTANNHSPLTDHHSPENPSAPLRLCVENPLPESSESKIENPKSKIEPDDFLGSIVVNPQECGAGVVIKWLEAEAIHNGRRQITLSEVENKPAS